MMIYQTLDSPVGVLTLAADDAALCHIEFPSNRHPAARAGWSPGSNAVLHRAGQQLREYFAGTRSAFDLPLRPRGTAFQMRVWQMLASIPFGQTRSYRQLAEACGNARAMRAVGAANGRNPLPIVIPCHRVIGADGSLTGFGGGIDCKRWLLHHEREPERMD
ncbi:MAG: methylated-DNA--[protein]-cysteine S-methyltransferase [Lysobacterales bacterium]